MLHVSLYRSCNKSKILDIRHRNKHLCNLQISQLSYHLMHNLIIPPKNAKTREPEDKQLCKLSAPYKEI